MSGPPPVSVVMPVYDALPFLDESIASILGQSFADFEFVILDDGSGDGSWQRLEAWAMRDPRIRLFRSEERLGPVRSSRQAVVHSKGLLVARMDADDVAAPERLARQVAVFSEQPDASLVGTLHEVIDAQGRVLRGLERWPLLVGSASPPLGHSSIMFRRDVFDRVAGYRDGTDFWEDIDLYARLSEPGRILVIPEALLRYRLSSGGTRFKTDGALLDASYERMGARLRGHAIPPGGALPPSAFVLSGSPRLWAGERPRVLGRLLGKRTRRWSRKYLAVLLWALWGEASPRSLRLALRASGRLKERRVPPQLKRARWVEWRPNEPGRPAG